MVTSTTLSALNAYQNQLSLMQEASDPAATGGNANQPDFASMVGDALKDAGGSMNNAEALQMQDMAGGKVDLTDLVTAVSNAELTLNTVVAVRDKVIGAYQSIIGMSI